MMTLDDIARRFGDGAHSIYAPSSSAMWSECAGSLIPNLLAPDSAGVDAAWGTVAHEITEEWLKSGERPDYRVGETWHVEAGGKTYEIAVDDEMLEFIHDNVRWVEHLPKPWHIEYRVDFSDLTPVPRQRGTCDFWSYCRKTRTLYVRDWKYGASPNNRVSAQGNSQTRIYAWGAYKEVDKPVERVNIGIGQPRLEHFDIEEISIDDLRTFARHIEQRARLAWDLNAPRTPSPKACKWCKVRGSCSVLAEQTEALTTATFDDLDAPADSPRDPKTLDTAALARILRMRKTIEGFLSDAYDEMLRRVDAGEDGHGFKMVPGRGRRAWRSKEATKRVLQRLGLPREAIITEILLSPNQAEHALKAVGIGGKEQKALLAALTQKPEGRPTLVEDRDPRPQLAAPGDGVFENLEDGDL